MRAPGEGSIYFDDTRGRWVGERTINGRRVRRVAKTKKEVAERLKVAAPREIRTVGDLIDGFLENDTDSMSDNWRQSVIILTDKHIRPVFENRDPDSVTVEEVEDWLENRGLARSTLRKLRGLLGQIYEYGQKRRHISWNPARLASLPATKKKRERRALTREELSAFLEAARGEALEDWIIMAVSLGLRPGEVSGLEWDAIDLDKRTATIRRSLVWVDGKPSLKSTKTGRIRTLALPDRCLDALLRREDRSGLVFTTESGTPLDAANIRRAVNRIADRAGIGKVVPYDLRATYTSLMSDAGVPPEVLADALGHVDTKMVFHHYRKAVTPVVGKPLEL